MTALEISKALAKAIGWTKYWTVLYDGEQKITLCISPDGVHPEEWRIFDHRDWDVIWKIAERYDAFPHRNRHGTWEVCGSKAKGSKTPQEAIALTVIGLSEDEK